LQEALTVVEDRFLNPSSLSIAGSEIRAVFALREAIKPVLYFKKDFILLSLTDIFCLFCLVRLALFSLPPKFKRIP
jgi:hypothetical protein